MKKYKPYLTRVDLVKNQVAREELREQEAKAARKKKAQQQNRERWLRYQEQLRSELAARYFHGVMSAGGESFSNKYSIAFDGVNDRVELAPNLPLGVMTISFWMKTTDSEGNKSVTGNGLNKLNFIGTSPLILLGSSNYRYFESQLSKFDGQWHHWLVLVAGDQTNDITNSRIFVDGQEINPTTTVLSSGPAAYFSNQLIGIGTYGAIAANIDEFAVWQADKTGDIDFLYNNGLPGDITSLNPVLYYRMGDNDGGTGTTVTDQGSGGSNGTLLNGATFEEDVPS